MRKTKPLLRLEHSVTHGNIWLSVLSLLKKSRAYAYVLPGGIERAFGFRPSKLMTYFVLYKLEDEGLISSDFCGRRKYYRLTKKGRETLEAAKKRLAALARRL